MGCPKASVYYCHSHRVFSCADCVDIHYRCEIRAIREISEIENSIEEVQRLVMVIQELSFANGCNVYLPKIENTLISFKDILQELETKINEAILQRNLEECCSLEAQIKEIRKEMADDADIREVLFMSASRQSSLSTFSSVPDEFSSSSKISNKIDLILKKHSKIMEKKHLKQMKIFEKECKNRLQQIFQRQIDEFKAHNDAKDILIQEKDQLINQNLKNLEDLKQQNEDLSTKIFNLDSENQQLKEQKIKTETELLDAQTGLEQQALKILELESLLYSEQQKSDKLMEEAKKEAFIKEYLMQKAIKEIKDFDPFSKELELYLNEDKGKDLVKNLGEARYKLNGLQRLTLSSFKDEDQSVNQFLTHCAPSSLKLFNFGINYGKEVNIKYYLKGLKSIMPNVFKENYLFWLIIDSDDLEQIVKLSANSERLVLSHCKISTKPSLDFSISTPYKTQFLGFQYSGSKPWHTEMDWSNHPDRFENIIAGIKNCSLKDSLKIINIHKCGITVSQVESLLLSHNLSHISVKDASHKALTS
ncbi:unnamed protein product [Moneuplotes crassus]|uniref:Uncharacterized protein n=1 Tax=Euplotes crassus TaxID=5936 RepID=A0AAD1Y955_EUPCR|nr:unnamed protein product [Moneuplotes crassus]